MSQLRNIFKDLTSSEVDEIDSLLNGPKSDAFIVTSRFRFPIRLSAFHCLKDRQWLSDEIINYYVELLRENSSCYGSSTSKIFFFQSFFYPKLRDENGVFSYANVCNWNKQVDMFCFQKIFVPMHVNGDHWALAVIEINNKRINYIDSLEKETTFGDVEILNMWLSREAQRMGRSESFEKFQLVKMECPQQNNGDDCGVFLLAFMHLIYLNEDINVMDSSMVHFMRRKVALSIVRETLQVT